MDTKITKEELDTRISEREDIETLSKCTAEPIELTPGASLEIIESFEQELESIVEQMWKDMTTETKLIEGVEVPEYTIEGEFVIAKNGTTEDKKEEE